MRLSEAGKGIGKFARELFKAEEADPLYYAMVRSGLSTRVQQRYTVAMLNSYYHHGLSGRAAQYQGAAFWDYLERIYPKAPRAKERRHFRGKAGLLAIRNMRKRFPRPEEMIEHLQSDTYLEVRAKVKALPTMLIGDYFIWKYADMQDCVFGIPCDFTGAEKFSSTAPTKCAATISDGAPIEKVYAYLVACLAGMKAPPYYSRPCGIPEAETVCCLWGKNLAGRYWLGMGAKKAYLELSEFPCTVNEALAKAVKKEKGWPLAKARLHKEDE